MDRQGFVQIEQLLSGLNAHNHFDGTVARSDLEYIIATSEKQRYEIVGDKSLLPMGRQYVHLSTDVETAVSVGMLRDEEPVILEIDAQICA